MSPAAEQLHHQRLQRRECFYGLVDTSSRGEEETKSLENVSRDLRVKSCGFNLIEENEKEKSLCIYQFLSRFLSVHASWYYLWSKKII